jgi:hypothetical protein
MRKSVRQSKRTQLLLIVLAAVVSFLPLVAERRQGNSIQWTVDGQFVNCEYFRVPSFSHVRSYEADKIAGVTRAPDSKNPDLEVVRLLLPSLNLNIPSQSSELVWNFDHYLKGLQRFIADVQAGDDSATYTWYHPWLIVGAVSVPVAVALWVLVFGVLLLGSKRRGLPADDRSP